MAKTNFIPLEWVGSSLKNLKSFPEKVQDDIGQALCLVQLGLTPQNAKPLKGFGGAGVLEILENFDRDTYRAVYTVKFDNIIYVLQAFQKKSTTGIATPQQDIDLIKKRLKAVEKRELEKKRQQEQ